MAAFFLEMSNWVCWPEQGGMNDQCSYLIDDVMMWFRIKAYMTWHIKHFGDWDDELDVLDNGIKPIVIG